MTDKWTLLQKEIAEWADKTFPGMTLKSHFEHLRDELDEIIADPSDHSEWADGLTIFLHCAYKAGLDVDALFTASAAKFKVNVSRKWGNPDSRGVVHHIREPGEC